MVSNKDMNKSIVMDVTSNGFSCTTVENGKASTVSLGFGPGLQELICLFIEGVKKERANDAAEEAEEKKLRNLNREISLAQKREILAKQMLLTLEAEGRLKEATSAHGDALRQHKAAFEAARKRAQQQQQQHK